MINKKYIISWTVVWNENGSLVPLPLYSNGVFEDDVWAYVPETPFEAATKASMPLFIMPSSFSSDGIYSYQIIDKVIRAESVSKCMNAITHICEDMFGYSLTTKDIAEILEEADALSGKRIYYPKKEAVNYLQESAKEHATICSVL